MNQKISAQKFWYSPVVINTQLKDTFSFTTQWAYAWYADFNKEIAPEDTARLFFTANCSTNVQGGYNIRYCNAKIQGTGYDLVFEDRSPTYPSEFYVCVRNDSFYFTPRTVYPISAMGEEISCRVNRQKLTLNKKEYLIGDIIIGYIDAEFTQIVKIYGKKKDESKLYIKGYFRTPLQTEPRMPKVH